MPDNDLLSGPPDDSTELASSVNGDEAKGGRHPQDEGDPEVGLLSGSVPPDDSGAQQPESEVAESTGDRSKRQSSIRRVLTRWGPLQRWSRYRMMERIERTEPNPWKDRDPGANAESSLPEGERVELPVIWVAELYTPSTVPGLLSGISKLGWDQGTSRDDSLVKWMSDVRQGRRAGWTSLGLVSPPDSHHFMRERVAPLPEGVDVALPVLISITPSLTAFVTAFLMSKESAAALDAPLRAFYSTRIERDPSFRRWHVIPHVLWNRPIRSGRRFYPPDTVRRDEARSCVRGLERDCTAWVGERMPGVFASSPRGTTFPTAVLMVTEIAAPLSDETRRMRAFDGLSIDRDYDAWESAEWPGGRLVLPRSWDDEDRRLVFACRRHDAFPDRAGYADPTSNWTIAQRADELLRGLLSRWAISCLLDYYHELVSALRDSSAARRTYHPVRDLKALRALAQTQLYDVVTSTQEIEEFVEADRLYRHDVLELTYVHSADGAPVDLLKELRVSQRIRAQSVQRDATLLQSTLSISSEITQTISNMRMQRLIVLLTVVSIGIALAAILITLNS